MSTSGSNILVTRFEAPNLQLASLASKPARDDASCTTFLCSCPGLLRTYVCTGLSIVHNENLYIYILTVSNRYVYTIVQVPCGSYTIYTITYIYIYIVYNIIYIYNIICWFVCPSPIPSATASALVSGSLSLRSKSYMTSALGSRNQPHLPMLTRGISIKNIPKWCFNMV